MSAPWPSLYPVSAALVVCGLCGLTYGAIVMRRARRQKSYRPVWQDWVWHGLLPCSVYAVLALTALLLPKSTQLALFAIGAAALGLLLVGIHNAWDSVTHLLVNSPSADPMKPE